MNPLLLGLLIAGLIEPKPHTPAIERTQRTGMPTGRTVLVVADGSRSWSGPESAAALDQLRFHLGPGWSVHVAWFDAETPPKTGSVVAGVNRDLVLVQPSTPMKDTVAVTIGRLADLDAVSVMVVIAHEQISPIYVRTNRLISSLRRSEVRIGAFPASDHK